MPVAGRPPPTFRHSDFGGRHPKIVIMPPVSWGLCRVHRCGVVGDLAAGLCVDHWDQGRDKRFYERFDERDTDEESAVE